MARQQKRFTREFKEQAVKLVSEQGCSISQVARDLGVHNGTLRYWVRLSRRSQDTGLVQEGRVLRTRVRQLEEEVRQMAMERDILKKAAAFFAKEQR